jgi:sortase A
MHLLCEPQADGARLFATWRVGWRQPLVALLLVLGLQQLLDAGWITMKAHLAQYLIADAWQAARSGTGPQASRAVKPWPWADTWPVARMQVPRLGVDLYVLNSDSGQALAFGPGHLSRSVLPGAPGVTVIAGHRDTHFAFLPSLQPGDELLLEAADGRLQVFRVAQSRVIDSRRQALPAQQSPPQDQLLLVTCYPFDALQAGGPLRYLVTAVPAARDNPLPQLDRGEYAL